MSNQIKLRKGDEVQEIYSMEITTVIMAKGDFAYLQNGHKIYSFSYFNGQHKEQLFSNNNIRLNVIYRLHKPKPTKVKKQHFGLYGQPIVVDLDKEVI